MSAAALGSPGAAGAIRYDFSVMGGPASVQLAGPRSTHTDALAQSAIDEVRRIEAKYSRYRGDSVIGCINANAGGKPIACDAETLALLRFADHLWRSSEGRFDATSGVLRRAWNFRSGSLPTQSQIDALLPLVGWAQVQWGRSRAPTTLAPTQARPRGSYA